MNRIPREEWVPDNSRNSGACSKNRSLQYGPDTRDREWDRVGRRGCAAVVLVLVLSGDPSRAPADDGMLQKYQETQRHMGTDFTIALYASDEVRAKSAFAAAFDRIRHLDHVMSDYLDDSELNKLSS